MSSDANESSPASLFKRSTNKKPRPRRERSPFGGQHDGDASVSAENVDQPSISSIELSPMTQVAKIKARHKSRQKMQGRLSFGAEDSDTGDEFKVKKSALSLTRKLTLPEPASTPGSLSAAAQLSNASYSSQSPSGLYSKSYLSELKASTPSTPSFKQRVSDGSIDVDSDMSMVYEHTNDSLDAEAFADIPSEASIKAAKEKRDRLRQLGVTTADSSSDDFISLSLVTQDVSRRDQGPHPESRLQREEDDLGEGDDDLAEYTELKERITLGKKARKNQANKRKATMAELIDEAEGDDDDEEMKDWEKSQLRRSGLSTKKPETPPPDLTYKPRPIPNITSLPSLTVAMSRLSGTLSNSQTAHQMHQSNLESVNAERAQLDEKEREMRELVAAAEAKRSWVSGLHDWMETIATFLDEKFPVLEKLEEEHLSLLAERLEMTNGRRKEDDEDDISLFLHLPAPKPVETEDEDEFGRALPQGPHAPTREARRSSRLARFAASNHVPSPAPIKLGLSADDESGYATDGDLMPGDLEDFSLAKEKLGHRVASLLDDVKSAEFRDPSRGLAVRFAEWRERWIESYSGAWGGLGMIGAWEFWARLEMVEWNPVEDGRPLDSFRWYSALFEYSRPGAVEADSLQDHELGPDGDLVASMISTAVMPMLCKLMADGGVDPYSSKHVKRAVDLAEQIGLSVDRKEAKFQAFAKAFLAPFRKAIEATHELLVPALDPNNPPPPFDPAAVPARRRFLTRRTKLLTGLLSWRKAVGSMVGLDDLIRRLLLDVMLPVAHGGWDVGGQEIMSKAKSLLPKDLARQEWTRPLQ